MDRLKSDQIFQLSKKAWDIRSNGFVFGDTKVGAALLTDDGEYFTGCNIEHRFRCHDIHAEVSAISNMISSGKKRIKALLIAAERDFFTPCGSCMDWIIQFAADDCIIGFQKSKDAKIVWFSFKELMPHYPR